MLKNITAQSCRQKANNWESTEVSVFLDKILSKAWDKACEGRMETQFDVSARYPTHFQKTLQEKLEKLGFKINRNLARWTISW